MSSELSGFYRLGLKERRARLAELAGLSEEQLSILSGELGLSDLHADRMVENAVGVLGMPLGVCVNLRVDGRDVLVPMAVEEPSVVAASSFAAKLLRAGGGIRCAATPPHMIGQIQILEVPDRDGAESRILAAKDELIAFANSAHKNLIAAGGGAFDVEVHHLEPKDVDDPLGPMLVVHLVADVRDAMGANAINTMCERLAPRLQELSGGRVGLRILSNLNDRRTVEVEGAVPFSALTRKGQDGEELARRIEEASVFAERDPYRAATHNKGIMNGVDAVLIAFGQDWRAVEAGAHAFCSRSGRYSALARWRVEEGRLVGRMEIPMAVGTVGGVAKVHPTVKVTRLMAGIEGAGDLAKVAAAVGLAQNLAAIRALAAEGIQTGHMRLHARNVAVEAGAEGDEVGRVARMIADRRTVNLDAARAALEELRGPHAADEAFGDVMTRFSELRDGYLPRILSLIEEVVRDANPEGSTLGGMLDYHMDTGGKRLRALTPLLVAQAFGRDPAEVLALGAACEMLHNATLVHDDLQDGDTTRRGKATVWAEYGMPQAVNLGDAMFYYTILLAQRLEIPAVRREAVARRVLVDTLRVIDGQEKEFALKTNDDLTVEDYFRMVEGKTSGLFALPMAGAAQVLGLGADVVEGLAEAARHLGVLFQIQDDVLDLYGDKGRDVRGSDVGEGKRSALVAHALTHASLADRAWLLAVLDRPREETTEQDVRDVMALFERVGSLDYTLDEIRSRRERAVSVPALQPYPKVLGLVAGLCDLFLQPIAPLLESKETVLRALALDEAVDLEFCHEMLPAVSRTFALSIHALPESLRNAVAIAYLLCRIVDTIEDEANIEPDLRVRFFDLFDAAMADDDRDPAELERLAAETGLGGNDAEKRLMTECGRVFRSFRNLPVLQRDGIRPHVLEMSSGMREYTARADAAGKLVLSDMEDLERYCYFVAGTVGNLLTALFEQTVPVLEESVRTAIRERAVAFGLGLQMVNIVKDVATDFLRGDVFLPEAVAREHGTTLEDLLAPQKRQESLAVVRAVCSRARKHLEQAAEYTTLWPAPIGIPVRQFCAVPLALALASLVEVESGKDTLRPGRVPKISREQVAAIFAEVTESVADDRALLALFGRCVRVDEVTEADVHVPVRPPAPPLVSSSGSTEEKTKPAARSFDGKLLVTGAAGHLGANLVRRLLEEGHQVRALLRHGSNNQAMDGLDVERVYADLRDYDALVSATRGVQAVLHCAAKVSTLEGSPELDEELWETNVVGTRNMLRAATACDVERVVVTGSFGAVGDHVAQAARRFEKQLPYVHTKGVVERECLEAADRGLDVVVASPASIVGPADFKPSRLGRTMIDYAHGQVRVYLPGGMELISTRDVATGHLLALERGVAGGKYTFSTEYVTLDRLMDLFEEVSGQPRPTLKMQPSLMAGLARVSSRLAGVLKRDEPRLTPGAVRILREELRADLSRAKEELGYRPTSIRAAIHDAYVDFARRGLVPRAPSMSVPDSLDVEPPPGEKAKSKKGKTAAA